MVKRIGTARSKTRHKLQKPAGESGKILISRTIRTFNQGDSVVLNTDSSVHKGMYHSRFHGIQGRITGKQGNCYEVEIKDGDKTKIIIVNPVHLKK